MCIRAIDYCPPVDVTLGDFLRALVTADADLFPQDERRYRVALVEAFRWHGLYPLATGMPSPLDLVWPTPAESIVLPGHSLEREPGPAATRKEEFARETKGRERLLAQWLRGDNAAPTPQAARMMGLAVGADAPRTIESPDVRVDSCRLARRAGEDGAVVADWVITVTQHRRGYFDPLEQDAQDAGAARKTADFIFRGGCTLLVDAASGRLRLCVAKDILSGERLAHNRESVQRRRLGLAAFSQEGRSDLTEPFFAVRGGPAGAALQR
jgi:hypothetical protein